MSLINPDCKNYTSEAGNSDWQYDMAYYILPIAFRSHNSQLLPIFKK